MAPDIITLHALSKDRNTTQTDLTAGQIPQLCVRSPDGIIKGHVVCNDGARADEFLDVAGQLPHGWGHVLRQLRNRGQ